MKNTYALQKYFIFLFLVIYFFLSIGVAVHNEIYFFLDILLHRMKSYFVVRDPFQYKINKTCKNTNQCSIMMISNISKDTNKSNQVTDHMCKSTRV